jgi:hypothetical protein
MLGGKISTPVGVPMAGWGAMRFLMTFSSSVSQIRNHAI